MYGTIRLTLIIKQVKSTLNFEEEKKVELLLHI
jgi:hypothetical protein